ncbi:MAG: hypothetical protein EBR95_00190 [Verrucomicrobia bacterium]|nr:hypothetical protein [Verrucomicrobiota bacterium]
MLLRLLLLLSPLAVFAQGDLIAEWQKQYDAWQGRAPRAKADAPQWSHDGNTLAYAWTDPAGISWRLVDCRTGKISPAFDPANLTAAFAALDGRKVAAKKWPFVRVIPMDDGRLRLESDKESWFLGKDGRLFIAAGPSAARPPGRLNAGSRTLNAGKEGLVSPDGRTRVELRDGGVFLASEGGSPRQLFQRKADQRETFVGPISWSPDGRRFAVWSEIKQTTRLYKVVDSVKGTTRDIPYDKPGDPRTTRTPWVFQADGKGASGCPLNVLPQAYATDRLDWSADSKILRTEYIRRGFTGHGIVGYDVDQGAWRKVLAEEDPKFVYTFHARYRHDVAEDLTLWASERTGWNHLYAVDLRTGETLRALTSGPWVVKQVAHLDAEAKEIYFQAVGRVAGENPYHQHLCKVKFDGSGFVDLTPEDAYHEVSFSPDRRTFIDTASRVDQPHATLLRSAKDGRILATLGANDVSDLRKAGWQPARPFVAKDRDGKFDIWGVVTRPHPFDPKKKYPVIENIYAGPHGSFAPRTFNWWHRSHRAIASFRCSASTSCSSTDAAPIIAARNSISKAGAT